MQIAIVGTAGRKSDGKKMSKNLYRYMYKHAHKTTYKLILDSKPTFTPQFQSGGAAWADHLAVSLFLGISSDYRLKLYLPARLNKDKTAFIEDGFRSAGSTSNYYHRLFSQKMGRNTILGIKKAIELGAEVVVNEKGFHARNLQVGDCDILIAYTWGEGNVPKDGGTKHCWDHSRAATKIHVPLQGLVNETCKD